MALCTPSGGPANQAGSKALACRLRSVSASRARDPVSRHAHNDRQRNLYSVLKSERRAGIAGISAAGRLAAVSVGAGVLAAGRGRTGVGACGGIAPPAADTR